MFFLADTANIQEIKKALDLYPILGITTNPSIIAREKKKISALVPDLHKALKGRVLHFQLISDKAADMVKEAVKYRDTFNLGKEFYAKLPLTEEGLRAIPKLRNLEIGVTATAVYTPLQAEMAAQAGADFVVPYVNRLDNLSIGGTNVIADIADIFDQSENHDCQILAASFKNVDQVLQSALAGAHGATLPVALLKDIAVHPMTEKAAADFKRDGAKYYG